MILTNFFTITKYGVNIILAVLGFISFEDVNQQSSSKIDQNIPVIEHVNYVDELRVDEQSTSNNLYYADSFYFINENKLPQFQPASQINYSITLVNH